METNCLVYMGLADKMVSGHITEDGLVYVLMPTHGGGWNAWHVQLSEAFMKAFNVSVYPGVSEERA